MNLTASDRSSLLKLASSLPVGDEDRRAILSGLKTAAKMSPAEVELEPWSDDGGGYGNYIRKWSVPGGGPQGPVIVYGGMEPGETDGFHFNIAANQSLFGYGRFMGVGKTLKETQAKADKKLAQLGFQLK